MIAINITKTHIKYFNIERPELCSNLWIIFVKVIFEEHKISLFIYCISYFGIASALSFATFIMLCYYVTLACCQSSRCDFLFRPLSRS